MARRSRKDAEETRRDIFSSARHLFETQGFSDTTIADICTHSGHSKGALFHYFASKETLFDEIWMALETEMNEATQKAAIEANASDDDPYAGFMTGCRVYLDYISHPAFQQIVNIDGPVVLGVKNWTQRDAALGLRNLGGGLRLLASRGLIEESRRRALTVLLYGALRGIAQILASGDPRVSAEELFAGFETIVRNAR